jgi:hypothetical protein
LVVSGLYDIPVGRGRRGSVKNPFLDAVVGGWQIGAITTWRSGFPENPYDGINRSGSNISATVTQDRPNATGQPIGLDHPTTQQWFNTAAFVLQPIYQFGNAGRNTIRGPAGFSLDSNLQKNFRLWKEGHELQFRWEAYNLLNHPAWGLPSPNLSSPAFGQVTSTINPMRQMQFALKYAF